MLPVAVIVGRSPFGTGIVTSVTIAEPATDAVDHVGF